MTPEERLKHNDFDAQLETLASLHKDFDAMPDFEKATLMFLHDGITSALTFRERITDEHPTFDRNTLAGLIVEAALTPPEQLDAPYLLALIVRRALANADDDKARQLFIEKTSDAYYDEDPEATLRHEYGRMINA